MSRPRRQRGFTLIELLVVVSLITLLIALLLPALRVARDEGRAMTCASTQRQWANAFGSYRVDHGVWPVFADQFDHTGAEPYHHGTFWWNTVGRYMGLDDIPPGLSRSEQSAISSRNFGSQQRKCPSDPRVYVGVHYGGFNSTTPNRAPINYGRNAAHETHVQYATHRERRPADWMLLCDTNAHFIYTPTAWTRTVDWDGDGEADSHPGVLGNEGSIHYYNRGRPKVHRDGGVYAFLDGHVERLPFEDWLDITHPMWWGR